MRKWNHAVLGVACLLFSTHALADEPSEPVTTGHYIPLAKRLPAGQAKPTTSAAIPAPLAAHFIALGPRNFNPALHVVHAEPVETAEDIPQIKAPSRPTQHASTSKEQAQQIISIFTPDQ